MQISTMVVAALLLVAGCAGGEMGLAAVALDGGTDTMLTATGGTGGSGGTGATGGSGGGPVTGGSGGSGGVGGAGGQPSPDAKPGAPEASSMGTDTRPAGPPQACVASSELGTSVCMDKSRTRVLYSQDRRACNICATYEADGRTVSMQYVGCVPGAGAICVMSCDECK